MTNETWTDERIAEVVESIVGDFEYAGGVTELPGGLLNRVWRVEGRERSVVAKHAPPYVASRPEVPLDPVRVEFEARALELFEPDRPLRGLLSDEVRPPAALGLSTDHSMLAMEDLGDAPDLTRVAAEAADEGGTSPGAAGERLGWFAAGLHALSSDDDEIRGAFQNEPVRETRRELQYEPIADRLDEAGYDDAVELGSRAVALADRIDREGRCLIMGDLWPRSVLVVAGGLRLIDWEFADWGWPAQDVGHLAAHAWMQAHRASNPADERAWREFGRWFVGTYRDRMLEHEWGLIGEPFERHVGIHVGAEILARTIGAFRADYVYAGLEQGDAALDEAVDRAVEALREPAREMDRIARR
ncbi:MAG: phosphotransferase [Bradymonadaceae bacterium]